MLHIQNPAVRAHLFEGGFGLEKENLRVTPDGYFAQTPHPFPPSPHITRDFCENQTEINTPVRASAHAALTALQEATRRIQTTLAALPQPELLWPFSAPPYIRSEGDIPIARFTGADSPKTAYREQLALRYGRYKMTLCGVHINYSFSDALLRADYAAAGAAGAFAAHKNRLYLAVAEQLAAYGWLLTAVTAASPLLDASYTEPGRTGGSVFRGMASLRCSELGYWNDFTPVLDYTSLSGHAASIQRYVDGGLLIAPSELYYPIRLKPRGPYRLDALAQQGVDHIELRMADLDPFAPAGLDERDLLFAQLLILWLASAPRPPLTAGAQVQAAQNFKNAAHYDLAAARIVLPDGGAWSAAEAGCRLLDAMQTFYRGFPAWVEQVLAFEAQKLAHTAARYAARIREQFDGGFVEKGLALARQGV